MPEMIDIEKLNPGTVVWVVKRIYSIQGNKNRKLEIIEIDGKRYREISTQKEMYDYAVEKYTYYGRITKSILGKIPEDKPFDGWVLQDEYIYQSQRDHFLHVSDVNLGIPPSNIGKINFPFRTKKDAMEFIKIEKSK